MNKITTTIAGLALLGAASAARAQFVIQKSTTLFVPSFRGDANSTYFEWTAGTFDSNPAPGPEGSSERLLKAADAILAGLNPQTPALGSYGGAGDFYQTTVGADFLASSNNIYSGAASTVGLEILIPINGITPGGKTTIIVQGMTTTSQLGTVTNVLTHENIAGTEADFVTGQNKNNIRQWWAKYEIDGNIGSYVLQLNSIAEITSQFNPISIANLSVDTYWAPTEFAPDLASLPEPASLGVIGLGAIGLLSRRRRKSQTA